MKYELENKKLLIDATAMLECLERIAARRPSQDSAATAFYRCRKDAQAVLARIRPITKTQNR